MDADLKAKWVTALRSGEYKQGRGRLHSSRNGTYCCLGVLIMVGAWADKPTNWNDYSVIPSARCPTGVNQHDLAIMNDGEDADPDIDVPGCPSHTFEQIATFIEENL